MIKKIFLTVLLGTLFTHGENISYVKFGIQGVNDQIDIFNVKESELGAIAKNNDKIGDMKGFDVAVHYVVNSEYSIESNIDQKRIDYLSSTLVNTHLDVALVKRIIDNQYLTLHASVGYEGNRGKDFRIDDLNTVNYLIDRFYPNHDVEITKNGADYWATMIKNGEGVTEILEKKLSVPPYGRLQNAEDHAFVIGTMIEPKIQNLPFDIQLFTKFKQIKVKKEYVTSLTEETDTEILDYMESNNLSDHFDISRTETMLTFGLLLDYQFTDLVALQTKYQYIKMFRDDHLQESDDNHNLALEVNYAITPTLSTYISGTVMSNQFNGVIPYFYDQYTQSTFDHKYGFVEVGFIVGF